MSETKVAETIVVKAPQTSLLASITEAGIKCLNLVTVLIALNLFASHANAQNDNALIQETNAQFYKALNAVFAGDLEPMKEVWSHSDDVTYMGPDGGFQKGWNQVLADWQKQAALKLGGKVEPHDTVITVGKDIVVCHNWEKGENKDKDGKSEMVSIRATNIFRKEGGKWKMIGHHTDLLPYLAH
jgi:ketosteroid isomerase-like protein